MKILVHTSNGNFIAVLTSQKGPDGLWAYIVGKDIRYNVRAPEIMIHPDGGVTIQGFVLGGEVASYRYETIICSSVS